MSRDEQCLQERVFHVERFYFFLNVDFLHHRADFKGFLFGSIRTIPAEEEKKEKRTKGKCECVK